MFALPNSGTRRRFLNRLGAGFGAVAWSALNQQAQAATKSLRRPPNSLQPYAASPPDSRPKARSVIFLFMVGGPSQIDTFDYKPVLQKLDGKPVPESIRKAVESTRFANVFHGCKDTLMASPFRWSRHGESGLWVSELMPHVAAHADRLALVHSMQAESNNHAPASYQLHTGDVRPGKASLGSWIAYGLGSANSNLPGYVMLFEAGPLGGAANYSNGFLPASYQPTRLRDSGTPVLDLLPPSDWAAGQRESLDLIHELNLRHRNDRPEVSELDARIANYELSYRMQSAALEVGAMDQEPTFTRKSYGLEHGDARTRAFARKCLMARRLVERGVRFVQVYDMPDKDGWDAHAKLTENHLPRARWTDQPVAALINDLEQRGLLAETLVIWASEFGRTPMMQGDQGRQHNAAGFTLWMAGGGVKAGTRIGATDELGLLAVDTPLQIKDLHATIFAALGLSHEELLYEVNGRLERLTGIAGGARVIPGILNT